MSGFICIDASVAAKWVLPEDEGYLAVALAANARSEDMTLVGPPHIYVEVTNSIRKRVARGDDDPEAGQRRLARFRRYGVQVVEPPRLYEDALEIANLYGRPSVYDGHYIALAAFLNCEFWTVDHRLIGALNGRLPYVRALRDFQT